jgi:flagellar basal body rod protein FlgG
LSSGRVKSLGRALRSRPDLKGRLPMSNALLVGLSRQVALGRELDVVANNIANLNTTGFKADGAVFEEFVGRTARADGASRADSQVSFVRDRATWIDMSQGSIERTGNSLDVAFSRCRRHAASATRATAPCRSTPKANS